MSGNTVENTNITLTKKKDPLDELSSDFDTKITECDAEITKVDEEIRKLDDKINKNLDKDNSHSKPAAEHFADGYKILGAFKELGELFSNDCLKSIAGFKKSDLEEVKGELVDVQKKIETEKKQVDEKIKNDTYTPEEKNSAEGRIEGWKKEFEYFEAKMNYTTGVKESKNPDDWFGKTKNITASSVASKGYEAGKVGRIGQAWAFCKDLFSPKKLITEGAVALGRKALDGVKDLFSSSEKGGVSEESGKDKPAPAPNPNRPNRPSGPSGP